MIHKFQLLKSSWGIVIFIDIIDITNPLIKENDIHVIDNIYIRINDTQNLKKTVSVYWFSKAITDLRDKIVLATNNTTVCYEINTIDFSHIDFQEEGLYYAMQEWLSKRYSIKIPESNAFYSKSDNKYIFPSIKKYLADSPLSNQKSNDNNE